VAKRPSAEGSELPATSSTTPRRTVPDILFVYYEVEPNLPRFPAASIRRERMPKPSKPDQLVEATKKATLGSGLRGCGQLDITAPLIHRYVLLARVGYLSFLSLNG
jgi:hypothetical protein